MFSVKDREIDREEIESRKQRINPKYKPKPSTKGRPTKIYRYKEKKRKAPPPDRIMPWERLEMDKVPTRQMLVISPGYTMFSKFMFQHCGITTKKNRELGYPFLYVHREDQLDDLDYDKIGGVVYTVDARKNKLYGTEKLREVERQIRMNRR